MKVKYRKWLLLPVALLLVSFVTFIAFAIENHGAKPAPPKRLPSKQAVQKPLVYDAGLLRRFVAAIHSLDFNKRRCTYRGMIDMIDRNDTAKNVRGLKFIFCRSGDRYYYQVGSSELIHQDSLNLFIIHDQRRVVLSKEMIKLKPPTEDLGAIEDMLRSESYELKMHVNGSNQILSLVNEYHITRKELSVTVDTVSGKLKRIYTRLTDFGNPMNKGKEKAMDVRMLQMVDEADMSLHPSVQQIIRHGNKGWELTNAYKDYELIRF